MMINVARLFGHLVQWMQYFAFLLRSPLCCGMSNDNLFKEQSWNFERTWKLSVVFAALSLACCCMQGVSVEIQCSSSKT